MATILTLFRKFTNKGNSYSLIVSNFPRWQICQVNAKYILWIWRKWIHTRVSTVRVDFTYPEEETSHETTALIQTTAFKQTEKHKQYTLFTGHCRSLWEKPFLSFIYLLIGLVFFFFVYLLFLSMCFQDFNWSVWGLRLSLQTLLINLNTSAPLLSNAHTFKHYAPFHFDYYF